MLLDFNLSTLAQRLASAWRRMGDACRAKTPRKSAGWPTVEALESRQLLTTITVTTLADTIDAQDGVTSLREALETANSTPAADTIEFFIGLNGSINLTNGELLISSPVTIHGNGVGQTVIDAQKTSRVISIADSAGNVTFEGLTITGGGTDQNGAGIYSRTSGTVTVSHSSVSGNSTTGLNAAGGGILMGINGSLVVDHSTIQANSANGTGGGIYSSTGSVTITDSRIEHNTTSGANGGGGGIFCSFGSLTITNSSVSNNATSGDSAYGGGIRTGSGNLTLINSTVSGNTASGTYASGGGIATGSFNGGLGNYIDPTIVIKSSTLSGNSAAGDYSYGGAMYVPRGSLILSNSTVSGNTAARKAGGLYLGNADLLMTNSTVVLNSSLNQGYQTSVGGIFASSGTATIYNSIIALNSGKTATDLHLVTGNLVIAHSLVGDNAGAPLSPAPIPDSNGNLVGTTGALIDPKIGPLNANGGSTLTHALLDSPAINLGDDTLTAAAGLQVDQTGKPRIDGSAVDMGAVEFQSPFVSFTTSTASVSETVGKYLVTVTLSEPSALPVDIGFIASGKADNPSDYTISASPLTIPAGQTSGTIQIDVVDSVGFETPEGIVLTFDKLVNGQAGAITTTTIIIIDGGNPPVATLSTGATSALEDVGTVAVTVKLSYAIGVDVTIPFGVSGTAGNPSDYTISATPLVIPAGQTSGTILINVANDAVTEIDKTVIVTLGVPVNATLGATTSETVTLVDDDFVPTVSFSGGSQSVNEGTASTTVTVNLSGPSLHAVTIPFGTAGSAVKSDDYSLVGSGFLVIPAGSTSGTITFNLVNDLLIEGDESFTVTLGTPTNGTLGVTTSTAVTIVDNDFNAAPLMPANQAFSISENSAASTIVGTVIAGDADLPAPYNTLTFSLTTNPGAAFSIDAQSGEITVANQFALNYEATPQIVLAVTATDGGNPPLSITQNVTINLVDINEPPQITSSGSPTVPENTTAVITVAGQDTDSAAVSLTYSISGGADFSKFTIDPNSGALSYIQAPNYESPTDIGGDNIYEVSIKVTENNVAALSFVQDIFIIVSNVNETPLFQSGAVVSIPENTTAVITVHATDPDVPVQALSYSISGGVDSAKFSINPNSGALTFSTAPNFEIPTDADANNIYLVTVKVTDNGSPSLFQTQNLQITVTNANDAPVITSSNLVSVPENTTAVTTVTAIDADGGQSVTFSISGGTDAARFVIDPATGVLAFAVPSNFEAPADSNADNIYSVAVKVTDNGIPNQFSTQNLAITVANANEPPAVTSSSLISTPEGSTNVLTVTATDPDSGQLRTFSISGGVDAGLFGINPTTGVLRFLAPPDFETPNDTNGDNIYSVSIKVLDNGSPNLFVTQDLTVTVTDLNEAPSITSSDTLSIPENTTAVTTVAVTDPDNGQTRTFSITGGADAALFAINPTTGVLTFIQFPNFEVPTDADGDNIYDVTVRATDNGTPSLFAAQDVAVTVTNDVDNPALGGGSGSVTYLKKQAPVVVMPGLTVIAPEGPATLGKIVISYTIPKGGSLSDITYTASSLGTVVESGATSFKKAGGTHTLTITLNQGVTAANIEAFLHSFRFSSKKLDTAKRPLQRHLEVQVFDRQGAASNKVVTQLQAKAK